MSEIFTFMIGIVFGIGIGWAMAALYYDRPRTPDAAALATTLDKLKRDE